jgi:hypothetical protein
MIKRVLLCALALLLLGAANASAARPCTADELRGARTPADLGDLNIETASKEPLIAGTSYRIVVVREYAIGDNGRGPVDSTIAVSAPNGPPLQPATADGRPAYDFTPTAAGTVEIVVSWDEEVGAYGSGETCSTSQTFDISVLQPTLAQTIGKFSPGPRTFGSSFTLRLTGKDPQAPDKVNVILRARRGTTHPPAAHGKVLATFVFKPTGGGHFTTTSRDRSLRRTFNTDTGASAVTIYPEVNIPFGRPLLFAFSFEVTQAGKRIGGLRAGAKCRRKQFRGHSAVKCRAVGLKQQP